MAQQNTHLEWGAPQTINTPDLELPTQLVICQNAALQPTDIRNIRYYIYELLGGTQSRVGRLITHSRSKKPEGIFSTMATELETQNQLQFQKYALNVPPGIYAVKFQSLAQNAEINITCLIQQNVAVQTGIKRWTVILGTDHPDQGVLVEFYDRAQSRYTLSNHVQITRAFYGNNRVMTNEKSVRKRDLSTVYLSQTIIDQVMQDIDRYLNQPELYDRLGISHKYNLLLHGLPGTGKTSLVKTIASHFDLTIGIITIDPRMVDGQFLSCFQALERKDIILFEDFDRLFEPDDRDTRNCLTLTGILNLLDGVESDGTIIIVTANNHENFDPAIRRRFDRSIEFGHMTEDQVLMMFNKFFPEQAEDGPEVVQAIQRKPATPAMIQAFFWRHIDSPRILDHMSELTAIRKEYTLKDKRNHHRDSMMV